MASVRLKSGSSHFFACFNIPTGAVDARTGAPVFRRVQRTTGTTDRARALQLAMSYERLACLAAEQKLTQRAARAFLAEVAALTSTSLLEVEAAGAFLHRWLQSRRASLSAKSAANYAIVLDQFIAHLGPRADGPLGDVTAHVLAAFRDAQTAAGKSPATVNKALAILAGAFDEAVAQGVHDRNPARGLNVRRSARTRQTREAFTFAQFSALVAAAEGEWRTLVLLCGYTGCRQQEAAQLAWAQVEPAAGRLALARDKTSDTHYVPLHPALAAHLRALRAATAAARPSDPVLPGLAAMRPRALSNNFRRALLPRIGLAQPYAPRTAAKGAGRILARYSLHSLRHGLSTWLHAAGVPEMMRMRLVGHSDLDVSRGYTHTDLAAAAAALGQLPSVNVPTSENLRAQSDHNSPPAPPRAPA